MEVLAQCCPLKSRVVRDFNDVRAEQRGCDVAHFLRRVDVVGVRQVEHLYRPAVPRVGEQQDFKVRTLDVLESP